MTFNFNEKNLSSGDKNLFEKDLMYRVKFISKYYLLFKNSESLDFLYFFCAYYNIEKLYKQISIVFKLKCDELGLLSYEGKFNMLCDIFSSDIKKSFKSTYNNKLKSENVKRINSKQKKDLLSNGEEFNFYFQDFFENNFLDSNCRTLVLYFRNRSSGKEQVDYLEFSIVYYILNWYISENYSKVFNNIVVVSRELNDYPKYLGGLFENFKYIPSYGQGGGETKNFIFTTSIFANTIHFIDGNYNENIRYFSIPIVSESIFFSSRRNLYLDKKVVLLKGVFYDRNNVNISNNFFSIYRNNFRKRDRYTGDFTKLMNTALNAVIELEDKLISELEN